MISSLCASTTCATYSPLYWTLSTMNLASSSMRVMTGSFMVYFLFLCISSTCVVFLFICEGCTPLIVPCTLSSPTCDVSPFPTSYWLAFLVIFVVLLGLLGIALLPDG